MKSAWCHPGSISGSEVRSSDQQVLLGWACVCGASVSWFHGWEPCVPHPWKAYSGIMGFAFMRAGHGGSQSELTSLGCGCLLCKPSGWDKKAVFRWKGMSLFLLPSAVLCFCFLIFKFWLHWVFIVVCWLIIAV